MLYVLAALLIGLYAINYRPNIELIACTDEIIATKPDVIMLGTWWCPYCADARRYFDKHKIHYCEYDIERTEKGKQMYKDIDGQGIPVIILGNKYKLSGFNEAALERALQLLEKPKQQL